MTWPSLVLVRRRGRSWIRWSESKGGQPIGPDEYAKLEESERVAIRIEDSWNAGKARRTPLGVSK